MSDGITDAVTYSQQSFSDWKKREIQTFLSLRSTKELVDELSKRDGVMHIPTEHDTVYTMSIGGDVIGIGNADYILVVKE